MKVDEEKCGDVLVLHVRDRQITSHEAPEMKTVLLGALLGETEKILLDLTEVDSMDSTGLGSLLFGIRQAEQRSKDLRFSGIQSKVSYLVHLARLEQVIDWYPTVEDALEGFRTNET